MKRKKIRQRLLLIGGGILIGFIIGLVVSGSTLKADTLPQDPSDRAVMAKHGYGLYLQFEYEIVTHSYGTFVVVKPRNGNNDNFSVAGL